MVAEVTVQLRLREAERAERREVATAGRVAGTGGDVVGVEYPVCQRLVGDTGGDAVVGLKTLRAVLDDAGKFLAEPVVRGVAFKHVHLNPLAAARAGHSRGRVIDW